MISTLHSRHLSIQKRKQFQNLRLDKSVYSPSIGLNALMEGKEFKSFILFHSIVRFWGIDSLSVQEILN